MSKYDYNPGDIIRAAADYKVVRHLGAGGMGAVYGVEHCELYRPFAIKLLHADLWNRADLIEMFGYEARTVARLGVPRPHPGIIEVVDLGRTKDRGQMPYMVMPWLVGETLHASLRRRGTLPALEAIGVVTRLCEALYHAHERGVIHRDVKPENIFIPQVTEGVSIQVLDWGISKLLAQRDDPSVFIGTPLWASKEQLLGQQIGPLSDIYSAGAVLFRCLTGKMPLSVPASSLRELIAAAEIPAPPLRAFGDFPRALEELVARALSRHAPSRPRDALVFAEELQEIARTIRRERNPHTHVTDVVERRVADASAVRPEPITAAQIAPRTIQDPDIPRRIEAERSRLLAEERAAMLAGADLARTAPLHAGVTGFERTEQRRQQLQQTAPLNGGLARREGTGPQAAATEPSTNGAQAAMRAMREAATNLPAPRSAPVGPPVSVEYAEAAPRDLPQGREGQAAPAWPPGGPERGQPRAPEPARPTLRSEPQPTAVTAPGPDRVSLLGRLRAKWRWLFGSRTWKELGRPMALTSIGTMLVVFFGYRFILGWLDERAARRDAQAIATQPSAPAPEATTEAAKTRAATAAAAKTGAAKAEPAHPEGDASAPAASASSSASAPSPATEPAPKFGVQHTL